MNSVRPFFPFIFVFFLYISLCGFFVLSCLLSMNGIIASGLRASRECWSRVGNDGQGLVIGELMHGARCVHGCVGCTCGCVFGILGCRGGRCWCMLVMFAVVLAMFGLVWLSWWRCVLGDTVVIAYRCYFRSWLSGVLCQRCGLLW